MTKIRHGHKAKMIPYLPFGGFEVRKLTANSLYEISFLPITRKLVGIPILNNDLECCVLHNETAPNAHFFDSKLLILQTRVVSLSNFSLYNASILLALKFWSLVVQFITGQAMLFTLGRSDGEEQGWFSMWLRMMGPDGWFLAWLKAKDQYTGMLPASLCGYMIGMGRGIKYRIYDCRN